MKTCSRLFVSSLLALVLAACSSGDSGGERQFLSVGTAPTGGAFFPVGSAIAEVLNSNSGDHDWQVNAEVTNGSQENIRRLDSGELDLAMSNAAISYFAIRGTEGWDKPYPIRTVMTLAPNVALFVTPKGSGIRELADMRGKRIVVGPPSAGFEFFLRPLLAAHGLTYDDFTPLNAGQTAAVDMLADGSAAAAFLGGAVPTASITQACASHDIYFIPFAADALAKVTDEYLFFSPATIKADVYSDLDEDFHGLDVGSMHLITHADKSDDLIYALTKAVYENREQVVQQHAAGKAINPKNVVRNTGTEFHPGAIRYYKEIGIWPEEPSH